jgi:hypothetical protein
MALVSCRPNELASAQPYVPSLDSVAKAALALSTSRYLCMDSVSSEYLDPHRLEFPSIPLHLIRPTFPTGPAGRGEFDIVPLASLHLLHLKHLDSSTACLFLTLLCPPLVALRHLVLMPYQRRAYLPEPQCLALETYTLPTLGLPEHTDVHGGRLWGDVRDGRLPSE